MSSWFGLTCGACGKPYATCSCTKTGQSLSSSTTIGITSGSSSAAASLTGGISSNYHYNIYGGTCFVCGQTFANCQCNQHQLTPYVYTCPQCNQPYNQCTCSYKINVPPLNTNPYPTLWPSISTTFTFSQILETEYDILDVHTDDALPKESHVQIYGRKNNDGKPCLTLGFYKLQLADFFDKYFIPVPQDKNTTKFIPLSPLLLKFRIPKEDDRSIKEDCFMIATDFTSIEKHDKQLSALQIHLMQVVDNLKLMQLIHIDRLFRGLE